MDAAKVVMYSTRRPPQLRHSPAPPTFAAAWKHNVVRRRRKAATPALVQGMKLPRSRRRDEDMLKEQYGAHYIAPVDGEDKAQRKVGPLVRAPDSETNNLTKLLPGFFVNVRSEDNGVVSISSYTRTEPEARLLLTVVRKLAAMHAWAVTRTA